MTKDEAMRMALDALRKADNNVATQQELWVAIGVIESALAQPKPKPIAWLCTTHEQSELVKYEDQTFGEITPLYIELPKSSALSFDKKVSLCKQFPSALTFDAINAIEAAHGIKD